MNEYFSSLKERLPFIQALNNRVILLHGSLAHVFEKERTFYQIPTERLVREMSGRAPTSLLLASPYIHSFVHETIRLSGKELERAGRYKLPFNRTVGEQRTISSITLNQKRALTVHSRLSPEGSELLESLRKSGFGARWRPAVLTFIQNLLCFSSDAFPQDDDLRIYLQEEAMQVCRDRASPDFKNYYYWCPERSFEQRKRLMDELLNKTQIGETATEIVFDRLEEISSDQAMLMGKLLYPEGKKRKLLVRQRTLKEKTGNARKAITLNRVLIGTGLALASWAAVLNFQLSETKRRYIDLQKDLAVLRMRSENLKRTAKTERTYFKLSSFWEAVERLNVKPDAILKRLKNILPPGIWIYRISINIDKIALVLLDSNEETELSELIELLDLHLGETSLEANEAALFENSSLKKYRLIINRSDADRGNEKMDKK